ncbi:MAG: DUF4956 domain-containing protein [Clostridiales bacterium]|nr:DUF4956 domain-containing protein [Clostridiales bacterium]
MNQLTFQDLFKNSVLESLQNISKISLFNVLVGLVITLLVGLFIFKIYELTFQGVVYSHSFNTSLVLLSLVTSLVIMTISSNIILSLGMVGALSIVRFRAAIKDPKDIVFMFWAIAAGIASGAGIYPVAVGGSLFIGIVLIIMSKRRSMKFSYLLIIKYDNSVISDILPILNRIEHTIKSKVVAHGKTELTLELKKEIETNYMEVLSDTQGVESAVLVKYNGDYSE